jgi:hypothetical protein
MSRFARDHEVPAVVRDATGETINAIFINGDPVEVFLTQEDLVDDKPCEVVIQIDKAQWPAIRDCINKCFDGE